MMSIRLQDVQDDSRRKRGKDFGNQSEGGVVSSDSKSEKTINGNTLDPVIVDHLACRVLGELQDTVVLQGSRPLADATDWLLKQCQSAESCEISALRDGLLAYGVTVEQALDICVTGVARALGEGWLTDDVSFATVTMASLRLMGLTEALSAEWHPRTPHNSRSLSLLVATPKGEQHILGATVLASLLRRQGHSVRLMLNADVHEVERYLTQSGCQAILMSLGSLKCLDVVKEIVLAVCRASHPHPRVVVGGDVILNKDYLKILKETTDVPFYTSDVEKALLDLERPVIPRLKMAAE